jgi:heme exporter protein B
VTLPLFTLFFNVSLWRVLPGVLGVTVLATIGFVAVGTIFSAMAVRTRFAELMLPVLLLPFMVPPLIGAVQVTSRLLADRPLSEMWGWLRLLALYDIVFVTLCALAFPAVVDE